MKYTCKITNKFLAINVAEISVSASFRRNSVCVRVSDRNVSKQTVFARYNGAVWCWIHHVAAAHDIIRHDDARFTAQQPTNSQQIYLSLDVRTGKLDLTKKI